jgi:hypothetical protein
MGINLGKGWEQQSQQTVVYDEEKRVEESAEKMLPNREVKRSPTYGLY